MNPQDPWYAVLYRYKADPQLGWMLAELTNTYRSYPQIDTDRPRQEAYAAKMMELEPTIEAKVVEFTFPLPTEKP